MQLLLALRRQVHLHLPSVAAAPSFDHKAKRLAAQDESHDPVMLGLQAFGKLGDRGPIAAGKSAQVHQQQVLQRRDTRSTNRLFAESQKASDLVAQLRNRLEILLGQSSMADLPVHQNYPQSSCVDPLRLGECRATRSTINYITL